MPTQPKCDVGINPSPSPHVQGSATPSKVFGTDGKEIMNFDGHGGTENILDGGGGHGGFALGKGRPD